MSAVAILRAAGLHTVANYLESVPVGAYAVLDNCVIRSKDVVESRRGQKTDTTYTAGAALQEVTFYGGGKIARLVSGSLARDTGSAWSSYNNPSGAAATPAGSYRMKFAQAAGRLYATSSYGVLRLNSLTSTALERAGVAPVFIDYDSSNIVASSVGYLEVDSAAAYRAVRVKVDPSHKESVGPPSSLLVVRNPAAVAVAIGSLSRSGTTVTATTTAAHGFRVGHVVALTPGEANFASGNKTITAVTSHTFTYTEAGSAVVSTAVESFSIGRAYVTLNVDLDAGAAAGDILRLYRTLRTATAALDPSDEFYLCYEKTLTAANVSAGLVAISDSTGDDYLWESAYFSASRDGISGSNDEPPLCDDVATFDDRLWFGNCDERSVLDLNLLATGGSLGLQSGDVLNFRPDGGTTISLTAGTNFTVFTGGDDITDVERTAQSIVAALHAEAANTLIRAEYATAFDDPPGLIRLTHEQPNASSYISVWASAHGTAWNPNLPTTEGDVRSYGFERANRVMHSKLNQPDAVPALNVIDVGDEDDAVLRILPLGDKLFVLKQRSVWVIAGPAPYSCYRLGGRLETVAPDSAAVLQDRIFVLTTQGLVAISEAGFDFIGLPVELDITSLFVSTSVRSLGFGIAYESERTYLIGLPSSAVDSTQFTQVYAYNITTQAWTRWPITRFAGGVNPSNDKLYMSDASQQTLYVERKAFDATDYADAETSVTISAVAANVLTMATLPVVGDAIAQGSAQSLVTAVTGAGPYSVTVQSGTGFTAAAATLYTAIQTTVTWLPLHMGHPDELKHLQGLKLLFRVMAFRLATLTVATEQVTTAATAKALSRASYALGFAGQLGPRNEHALIPQEHGRAAYFTISLTLREARARWKLQGLVAKYERMSEREPRT